MAIQVRRGNEADFDASKMLPGEWAVSLDTQYVRMCFAPGIVLRMATYEGFENDKAQIQSVLAECQNIQSAVERIQSEVNAKASLTVEYSNFAKESADRAYSEAERAKIYANNAEAVTGVQIATRDRAGLVKGGDNYIEEDGTLMFITTATSATLHNSHSGRLKIDEIGGVMEQDSTTGKNLADFQNAQNTNRNVFTYTTENAQKIVATKKDGTGGSFVARFVANLKANTTYHLSLAENAYQVYIYYDELWGKSYKTFIDTNNATFTPTQDSVYVIGVFIPISNDSVSEITVTNFMIEEGTVATEYEPYTNGPSPNPLYPQEIRKSVVSEIRTHGKNFFNKDALLQNSAIDSNTGSVIYASGSKASEFISITMPCVLSGSYSQPTRITFYNENYEYIKSEKYTSYPIALNIAGAKFIRINGNAIDTSQIQLEEGTVATEYEPYTESVITLSQPIDLYGMNGVQDVLTTKQIKRKYKEVVFDGTENFTLSTTTTGGGYYFRIEVGGVKQDIYGGSKSNALCTRLTQYTPNYLWENDIDGFSIDSQVTDTQRIRFRLTSEPDVVSVDALKAKLAEWYAEGKPLTFVLELAEETTEELPLADQIALNSIPSYDGITYVEFISDIQPTFKGEYGTSKVGGYTLEAMLAGRNGELYGQSYDERLSALEASVVNNI